MPKENSNLSVERIDNTNDQIVKVPTELFCTESFKISKTINPNDITAANLEHEDVFTTNDKLCDLFVDVEIKPLSFAYIKVSEDPDEKIGVSPHRVVYDHQQDYQKMFKERTLEGQSVLMTDDVKIIVDDQDLILK